MSENNLPVINEVGMVPFTIKKMYLFAFRRSDGNTFIRTMSVFSLPKKQIIFKIIIELRKAALLNSCNKEENHSLVSGCVDTTINSLNPIKPPKFGKLRACISLF